MKGNSAMLSILFLTADPKDVSRLRLGEEAREIHEQLQRAKLREQFDLHQRTCIRPADLTQAMLDLVPDIVHFSGHGDRSGELCFEDTDGFMKPISPDALGALFYQFRDTTKCVVLNACYSESQAKTISEHIDFVVGMNTSIGDASAIAFSIGFYQALGAGRSVDEAYELGCIQIRLQGLTEQLTPVLLRREGADTAFPQAYTRYFWPGFQSLKSASRNTPDKLFPLIHHRLHRDEEQMRDLAASTPSIEILETDGSPVVRYLLRYNLKGIVGINEKGDPKYANHHLAEMVVPDDYPMGLPYVQFYTPVFHPNIYELGQVCHGWFGIPYELRAVAINIGRMIDYQVFSTKGSSNHKAAAWASEHEGFFPLQNWTP
jgi:ubiquitin-protein ligase